MDVITCPLLGLKLIHVSKRGHWETWDIAIEKSFLWRNVIIRISNWKVSLKNSVQLQNFAVLSSLSVMGMWFSYDCEISLYPNRNGWQSLMSWCDLGQNGSLQLGARWNFMQHNVLLYNILKCCVTISWVCSFHTGSFTITRCAEY